MDVDVQLDSIKQPLQVNAAEFGLRRILIKRATASLSSKMNHQAGNEMSGICWTERGEPSRMENDEQNDKDHMTLPTLALKVSLSIRMWKHVSNTPSHNRNVGVPSILKPACVQ